MPFTLTQVETVIWEELAAQEEWLGTVTKLADPSKLPAPSTFPSVAVAPLTDPLFAFDVESFAVRVLPFGRCQTPLKFVSQTFAGSAWLLVMELFPYAMYTTVSVVCDRVGTFTQYAPSPVVALYFSTSCFSWVVSPASEKKATS